MNRIRDATFILISALAVVFLLGGYFLLEDKNRLIETTQKELKGVQLERALFGLLLGLLDERDIGTNAPATEHIRKFYDEIDELTASAISGNALLRLDHWQNFKSSPRTAATITQLMTMMRDVGDNSTLILDPEMASYYLVDITVNLLPPLMEHLSQSRSKIIHTISNEYVESHLSELAPYNASLNRSIDIVQTNKSVTNSFGPDSRDVNNALQFYTQLLQAKIAAPNMLTADIWVDRINQTMQSYVSTYNASADLLALHLKQRIKDNKDGRIFTILFLLFLYFFVIIIGYFALKNYVQKQEVLAAREMTRIMGQLEKTNNELEHFAYVASHDLKEPLRTIASFAKLLQQKYSDVFDATGKEYLNILMTASIRMQQMISDLLNYARVDYELSKVEPFDCMEELQHVLENLKQPIEQSGAVITCDAMPVITHHGAQFARLMQNLISNAIKYRREGIAPLIHIGLEDQADTWQFSVKDNGIGIDKAYFDKIFQPFKRLHTQQQFEGTGIGLAICKKMVERMGGKLWLTSTSNEGSTFYFTLLKNAAI
ncbi:MAG: hypothetical protein K2Q32_03790 [Alphaproteobacteria bacterium]|nr:hypothetical protein [Alphaproteobacteria bacterium]